MQLFIFSFLTLFKTNSLKSSFIFKYKYHFNSKQLHNYIKDIYSYHIKKLFEK